MCVDPEGFSSSNSKEEMRAFSRLKRLDECAISVVKVHPNGWWVKEIVSGRWGVKETAYNIVRAASDCQAMVVGVEKGALFNALLPYLTEVQMQMNTYLNVIPTTHGHTHKVNRIQWALQGRLEHGKVVLNPGLWNKKLIEQCLDFPSPLSHDDLPDSLSYIDQISQTMPVLENLSDQWRAVDDLVGF